MIFVAVGTSANGFDELVVAADRAAAAIGLGGLAQIGDGRFLPLALRWQRVLPDEAFRRHLAAAGVVMTAAALGRYEHDFRHFGVDGAFRSYESLAAAISVFSN